MATVTVKHVAANPGQVGNIRLLCQIGKSMGATAEQLAGAHAVMTQESTCVNLPGGDRDSAGLFQQRPSCGWGSYKQVTDPNYAIRKFMSKFLPYCHQGIEVIRAGQKVQGSGFAEAPRQWLTESRANVSIIMGSQDFGAGTGMGDLSMGVIGTDSNTRVMPYEFSRGTADGPPETSWDCMGRLAQEVKWDRFMRRGELWFVSEDWLRRQSPQFTFAVDVQGVLSITFEADSRRNASEATVRVLARRWAVAPGDVVRVAGQGPGDGLWLVSSVRRTLSDPVSEVALRRWAHQGDEPANQTTSKSVMVGGDVSTGLMGNTIGGGAAGGSALAQKVYNAAKAFSDMNLPYDANGPRSLGLHPRSGDCSSSVSWALLHAGVPLPGNAGPNSWAPVSGAYLSWGMPGMGQWITAMIKPGSGAAGHIWLRFTGKVGPAWRFDTSPYGSPGATGASGPRLRFTSRPTTGFVPRHWQGL